MRKLRTKSNRPSVTGATRRTWGHNCCRANLRSKLADSDTALESGNKSHLIIGITWKDDDANIDRFCKCAVQDIF